MIHRCRITLLRNPDFFWYHGGFSSCNYSSIPFQSMIHFGGYLSMLRVVPGLIQLLACWNSKTKACSGEWNLAGLPWTRLSIRTHRILDRNVGPRLRVIRHTWSECYSMVKWPSWFRHWICPSRRLRGKLPASSLPFPNSFWLVLFTDNSSTS